MDLKMDLELGAGKDSTISYVDSSRALLFDEKPLPEPPVALHPLRHGMMSFYYRRVRSYSQKLSSYRFTILCCAWTGASILLANIAIVIWASRRYKVEGGLATIYSGNCDRSKNLSFWFHLIINILSTLLVGASNYTMQCLASPTRKDIDRAHNNGTWLHIGVPNIRNLRMLPFRRTSVWWLLVLSTVPIHLFYNSAVFSTLSTRNYSAFLFPANSTLDAVRNVTLFNQTVQADWVQPAPPPAMSALQDLFRVSNASAPPMVNLSNYECIQTYTSLAVSSYSHLLLMSSHTAALRLLSLDELSSEAACQGQTTPHNKYCDMNQWLCSYNSCSSGAINQTNSTLDNGEDVYTSSYYTSDLELGKSNVTAIATIWEVNGYPIDHCLAMPAVEQCKLQFSFTIMVVVIVCNLIKTTCMVVVALRWSGQPLVTVGDAIASFLDRPDSTTEGSCLWSKTRFRKYKNWTHRSAKWKGEPKPWFCAATTYNWLLCYGLYILGIFAAIMSVFSVMGRIESQSVSAAISSAGFGRPSAQFLLPFSLPGSGGVIAGTIIANFPQLILTVLYFTYNSIFTSMLLAAEWNGYGVERKALRVSSPTGLQRTTYNLQLPYRYGLPLLVVAALLHWVVSQSLFLVTVAKLGSTAGDIKPSAMVSTCGFSPMAILCGVGVGVASLIFGLVAGFRWYRGAIPLVASCSAAISAACHPPREDVFASQKRVMFGEVKVGGGCGGVDMDEDGGVGTGDRTGNGHCCFTSFPVTPPVKGKLYGGFKETGNAVVSSVAFR